MSLLSLAASVFFPPAALAMKAGSFVLGKARGLSPKAWLGIGIAVALVVGFFVHRHYAHKALAAEYARGASDEDAKWQKRLDDERKTAMDWKAKADAASSKISQEERAKNDAERDAIAARADDQRMRGPGKAAAAPCGGPSGTARLPAASGGPVPPSAAVDASVAGLPPGQGLAVVQWDDLTAFAASHDGLRAEVSAWRAWYTREAKTWADAKAAVPTKP